MAYTTKKKRKEDEVEKSQSTSDSSSVEYKSDLYQRIVGGKTGTTDPSTGEYKSSLYQKIMGGGDDSQSNAYKDAIRLNTQHHNERNPYSEALSMATGKKEEESILNNMDVKDIVNSYRGKELNQSDVQTLARDVKNAATRMPIEQKQALNEQDQSKAISSIEDKFGTKFTDEEKAQIMNGVDLDNRYSDYERELEKARVNEFVNSEHGYDMDAVKARWDGKKNLTPADIKEIARETRVANGEDAFSKMFDNDELKQSYLDKQYEEIDDKYDKQNKENTYKRNVYSDTADAAVDVFANRMRENDDFLENNQYDSSKDSMVGTYNAANNSYGEISDKLYEEDYMTMEERQNFNYLYNKAYDRAIEDGWNEDYAREQAAESAKAYMNTLGTNKRRADMFTGFAEEYAKEHPVAAAVTSVALSPAKGIGYVANALDFMTGKGVDQYSVNNLASQMSSTMRNTVREREISGPVGKFVYDVGMSMGDMWAAHGVGFGSNTATLGIMGTGAAEDTLVDLKSKGYSDEDALILASVAGAAEIITEKLPLEAIFNPNAAGLKNILKSMGEEGLEEIGSDVINDTADLLYAAITGKQGEIAKEIEELMSQGMSEDEAKGKVIKEHLMQYAYDGLAGAASGGASATMQSGINYAQGTVGQGLAFNGVDEAKAKLMDLAKMSTDEKTKALAKKVSEAKGGVINDYDTGKLVDRVIKEFDVANEVQSDLKEAGVKNAEQATEVVVKALSGIELNENEQKIYDSTEVQSEMEKISSGELDSVYNNQLAINEALNMARNRGTEAVNNVNTENVSTETENVENEAENEKSLKNPALSQIAQNRISYENTRKAIAGVEVTKDNIDSIESVGEEGIKVKLKDGRVVDSFMARGQLESVIRMANNTFDDANAADVFVKDYNDSINVGTYTALMNKFIRAGQNNANYGDTLLETMKNGATKYLFAKNLISEDTLRTMYQYGKEAEQRRSNTVASQSQRNLVNSLANLLGVNVEILETNDEHNGYFKDGKIFVSTHADKAIASVLSHEFTHYLKDNSKLYKNYEDAVIEYLKDQGKYEEIYEAKKKLYEGLDEAAINEEIAADAAEEFLMDEKAIKKLCKDNKSLANKIVSWLKNIVSELKKLFGEVSPRTAEGKALRENINKYEQIRDMWIEAVQDAKKNETAKKEMHVVSAYISSVDSINNKKDANEVAMSNDLSRYVQDEPLASKNSVAQQKNSFKDSQGNTLSEGQQKYFKDSKIVDEDGNLLVVYHGTPTGGFTVFKNDLNFYTANKKYADSYQNPSASSRVSGKDSSNPMTYEGYLKIEKPFTLDDPECMKIFINDYIKGGWALGINPYQSDADIKKQIKDGISWEEADNLKEFFDEEGYDYDGIILDEGGFFDENNEVVDRGISFVTFDSNQFKNIDNLNPTKDKDIRFSKKDSEGNNLTENQIKYFKDSLVRDESGNLKVVYHGTPSDFTVFDPSKIGTTGSAEGYGFYFTDKEEKAAGYKKNDGNIMKGYLKIQNPLSLTEKTLNRKEVEKLIRGLDETGDLILSDYDASGIGYPSKTWYNNALKDTLDVIMENDTDVDLVAEIANVIGKGETLTAIRNTLGYDGFITEDKYSNGAVYVAFESNQFKDSTNENPTDNEDIRYSNKVTFSTDNKGVTVFSGYEFGKKNFKSNDEYESYVKEFAEHTLEDMIGDKYIIKADGRTVEIGSDMPHEYVASKDTYKRFGQNRQAKISAIQGLKEIIENATLPDPNKKQFWVENTEDKHNVDAKRGWLNYQVYIGFNNPNGTTYFEGYLKLRMDENGKDYVYDITDIKKVNYTSIATGKTNASSKSNSLKSNIPQQRNSIKDSTGKTLTPSQAEYFKDSKIRDEEGNLRVVYHGTNTGEFYEFKKSTIGSSNDSGWFGKGYYFAFTKPEASMYGSRVLDVYLNVKNPFMHQEYYYGTGKTKNDSDLAFFDGLIKLNPKLGKKATVRCFNNEESYNISMEEYIAEVKRIAKDLTFKKLENEYSDFSDDGSVYGYEYKGQVVLKTISKVEIPSELYEAAETTLTEEIWDEEKQDYIEPKFRYVHYLSPKNFIMENNDEYTKGLKNLGYDGIMQSRNGDEVVAFDSNQIKLTTNENPTTDNDIRFSLKNIDGATYSVKDDALWDMIDSGEWFENDEVSQKSASNTASILKEGFEALSKLKESKTNKINHKAAVDLAKDYQKKYNSSYGVEYIAKNIESVFAYIQENVEDVRYDDMLRVMHELALPIVENSKNVEEWMSSTEDFRKYVKDLNISLNEQQRAEVVNEYGSMKDFRKAVGGRINVTSDGINIDDLWSSIVEASGYMLDPDENSNSQIIALADAINEMKDVNPNNESGMTTTEQAYDLALNIFTDYFKKTGMKGITERLKEQMAAYKTQIESRYDELLRREKEKTELEIKNLKNLVKQKEAEKALILDNNPTTGEMYEASNIDRTIENYKQRIEQLKQKNLEAMAKRKEAKAKASRSRKATQLRNRIKNIVNDLQKRLVNPTEGHHVPKELVNSTIAVLEAIDLNTNKTIDMEGKLAALKEAYEKTAEGYGEGETNPDFDPGLVKMISYLKNTFKGRSVAKLSNEELEEVLNICKAIQQQIRNQSKLINSQIKHDIYKTGKAIIEDVRESGGIDPNKRGENVLNSYINASVNAERFFNKISGYKDDSALNKLYEDLNEGSHKMMQIQLDVSNIMKPVLEGKENQKLVEKFKGDDVKDWIDTPFKDKNGKTIRVPQSFRASLALHMENADNMKHMIYGGITLPNEKLYKAGKISEAYQRGETIRLLESEELKKLLGEANDPYITNEEREQIRNDVNAKRADLETKANKTLKEWIDGMTEYEKAWVENAKEYFWNYSGKMINDTSLKLNGYEKAIIENYFPIKSDPAYTKAEMEGIKMDATLEGWGNLKNRVHGSNPIVLEGLDKVINGHSMMLSKYAGLAIPIRNFNKVYNVTLTGYKDSVKKAIGANWGESATRFINNLFTDLQTSRAHTDGFSKAMNKIRGNFAQSTLTTNISVAMKQAASFPTAAAELGWKALGAALMSKSGLKLGQSFITPFHMSKNTKQIMELAEKYTPLLTYRNLGNSTQELGDLKSQRTLISKVPGIGKVAGNLTNWIQNIDTTTVATLWTASEYRVAKDNPNLKKGTDEFYKEVAKVFNKTVERTQPNYSVLQRPDILRNPNEFLKQVFMFKTQPLQNFGIMIDSFGELKAKTKAYKKNPSEASLEALKNSKKRFALAVSSQIAAAATFSAMTLIANAFLHRMNRYRDDDDEISQKTIWERFVKDINSCLVGGMPLGSEIYSFLEARISGDKYYGLNVSTVDAVNELVDSIDKLSKSDLDNLPKNLNTFAEEISTVIGIPYENMEKLINGMILHSEDIKNDEFLSFEAGLERTVKTNYRRLYKAMANEDEEKFDKVYNELIEKNGKEEKDIYSGNGAGKIVKIALTEGEIDTDTAEEYMEELGMDETEAHFKVQEWETGSTSDYAKVYDAISNYDGTNSQDIINEVNELKKYGYDDEKMKSNTGIAGKFKEEYIELYNTDKKAAAELQQAIIIYYGACGKSKEQTMKQIQGWLK